MKFSITLTFTALFLGVAAAYYYWIPHLEHTSSETEPAQEAVSGTRLLPFDKDNPITWIQIQNIEKNFTVTLEKKDKDWQIKYPVADFADHRMAEGLVAALKLSTRARRFKKEKGWNEYGLLRPEIKVGVGTADEARRYLYFGDPSPVGTDRFARWEGEPEYFLVKEELKRAFERSVYSMRRKEVFTLPMAQIEKIYLHTSSEDYEILKKEGEWFWTEPIPILGTRLHKNQTDEILSAVTHLYIKDFLDGEKPSLENAGLDGDAINLTLAAAKESQTLRVGRAIDEKDGFYAQAGESPNIVLMAQMNLRKLFEMIETMAKGAVSSQPSSVSPSES